MPKALRTVRARITLVAAGAFAIAFTLSALALDHVVDTRVHNEAKRAASVALDATVREILATHDPDPSDVASQLQQPVLIQYYFTNGVRADNDLRQSFAVVRNGTVTAFLLPKNEWAHDERTVHFTIGTRVSVPGIVVVATSLESANRSVDTVRRALWIATPWLIFLVAVIVWWLVGRALQPVEHIREEVESITSRTIDQRVAVPDTDDEVAHLADTMNAMLDRLDTAQQRQREFVFDASHELRSPVASMRT